MVRLSLMVFIVCFLWCSLALVLVFLIGMRVYVTVVFRLNKCPAQNEMREKSNAIISRGIFYQEIRVTINMILPSQMTNWTHSTVLNELACNLTLQFSYIEPYSHTHTDQVLDLFSQIAFSYAFCENVENFLHWQYNSHPTEIRIYILYNNTATRSS